MLPQPLLIWGAGAIGATLGAYWARAGYRVVLVDREQAHVDAINAGGLKIEGPIETFSVQLPAFTPQTLQGSYPAVILAVKAQHTGAALEQLLPFLEPQGFILSAQNGLNEEEIAAVVGAPRTVGCFVNFGADYLGPGQIHFGGRGAVVLGELDGSVTPRLQQLLALFQIFDPQAITTTQIWGYLWGKLAYGAQLFATALTNDSIADALDNPAHHRLYIELAREVLRVAQALGIAPQGFNGFDPLAFVPGASLEKAQESLAGMVAHNRRSAKTHSGIWRDLAVRKRKTEAEAQLGAIVAAGQRAGVPTPITARLLELIGQIEQGQRVQGRENLDRLSEVIP